MKLSAAASHFNKDRILDGYTGDFLFLAHTTAHDDHTSSGATSRRRTMTTKPEFVAPARRVVQIYDEFWIVGNSNVDGWNGSEIRKNFGLKKAVALVDCGSPGQMLGSATTSFYIQKEYFKDSVNPLTDSDLDVFWNIFCPFTEVILQGYFFRIGSDYFRVRGVYPTVDEYLIAEADQFDADAYQPVAFQTNGKLDLITGQGEGYFALVYGLQTDQAKFYHFRDEVEAERKPGDRTVFVPASLVIQPGATFGMLGATWNVLAVVPELDALALHVRRV